MAIVYVGERAQGQTVAGAGSTQAITLAGATAAGTLILVFAARDTSAAGCSVADSKGNTWTIDLGPLNTYNNFMLVASTRQNAGNLVSGDTVTITFGTAPNAERGWLVEHFTGLAASSYVDKIASNSGIAAIGSTGTTAVTAQAVELAVSCFCITSDPAVDPITGDSGSIYGTGAYGSGMYGSVDSIWANFTTSEQAINHGGFDKTLWSQYKILAATGTQSSTISWTNTAGFQAGIVTYASAALSSTKAGFGIAGGVASGTKTKVPGTAGKAGFATSAGIARGASASVFVERGTGKAGLTAFGASEVPSESGTSNVLGPVVALPSYRYVDLVPSYDLDNVFNRWTATRDGGSPQTWEDAASQEDYFLRAKQTPTLVSTDSEALNQAQWKIGQYSQPINRVEAVTVMPFTDFDNTAQIDAMMGRELGDRISIIETPPGFTTAQERDYVIQHIEGTINIGPIVSASLTWQVQPASLTEFWIVGDEEKSLAGLTTRPAY